jgi:predicted transcriptional regulator
MGHPLYKRPRDYQRRLIVAYTKRHDMTVREIAADLGVPHTVIVNDIYKLVHAGKMTRRGSGNRLKHTIAQQRIAWIVKRRQAGMSWRKIATKLSITINAAWDFGVRHAPELRTRP